MEADGYRAMKQLLAVKPRIDAVFAANDPSAIGAMKAIWEAGLRVPDDIAVVGAGDIALGDLLRVPLTTVSWSRDEQGKRAAELMLERIDPEPPAGIPARRHPAAAGRAASSGGPEEPGNDDRRRPADGGGAERFARDRRSISPPSARASLAGGESVSDEAPITITASRSPRSAGGPHDFFSEGDYWWPDPEAPGRPVHPAGRRCRIPANFVDHRRALMRLSVQVPALVAAWRLTHRRPLRGARRAAPARLVRRPVNADEPEPAIRAGDPRPRRPAAAPASSTPFTWSRSRARSSVLHGAPGWTVADDEAVRRWFADYLDVDDDASIRHRGARREEQPRHLLGDAGRGVRAPHRQRAAARDVPRPLQDDLLPTQMAPDGSFPLELARTKPYGYSLFNLDAMATICQIPSTPEDNLWTFELPDGRGMRARWRS